MICSLCGQNKATVHVNKLETDLCDRCHTKMIEIVKSVNETSKSKTKKSESSSYC